MNLYIDESGSINNKNLDTNFFIISIIHVHDKKQLDRTFKRFVSSNHEKLKVLDFQKINTKNNKIQKHGNKMFINNKFKELKGSQFDIEMKKKFVHFFSRKHTFDIYYIKINNHMLTDRFCSNTSRAFNYALKVALEYFITQGLLPDDDCCLQLDQRNEKTEAKYFLENYLNTEFSLNNSINGNFKVSYFDSENNKFIQVADVFANIYYSHLKNNLYSDSFELLQNFEILKFVYEFPEIISKDY